MIKAGIIGAAGYTGGELIRLLFHHPEVSISFAQSNSQAGKPVSSVHQDLSGDTELIFTPDLEKPVDVLFLCAGHGAARKFLAGHVLAEEVKIIDLSQDFRLKDQRVTGKRSFTYGLPEIYRDQISVSCSIANPGCFATAIQLGLLPLIQNGFSGPVYTTGITGATGAGQGLSESAHFAWRCNNIQAYKSLEHQHIAEITEQFKKTNAQGKAAQVHFIPWRGDFARGIFVSQQLQTDLSLNQLYDLYHSFYHSHPFTWVSTTPLHLKQVVHTNKCMIHIEQQGSNTVIHSMIDNLIKGASGQAVQNMNLMSGLEETAGLQLKAGYF